MPDGVDKSAAYDDTAKGRWADVIYTALTGGLWEKEVRNS